MRKKKVVLFIVMLGGQTWDLAHELSTLPKWFFFYYVCSVYMGLGVKFICACECECSCMCNCTHVQVRGQPWVSVFHVHLI